MPTKHTQKATQFLQRTLEINHSDDDDDSVHEDIETPKVTDASKVKVAMGREIHQVC